MGIKIENPGFLTSVQDEGRFGHQKEGLSPAGAMDSHAMKLANILVDNPVGEAVLEITMVGPVICFESSEIFAIAGGDLTPRLDGVEIPMNCAVCAQEGSVLDFAGLRSGCRAYIAFSGGLDVPILFQSKSTLIRNGIGGVDGRKLQAGDVIPFSSPRTELPNMALRLLTDQEIESGWVTLRVTEGPQQERFTEAGLKSFYHSWYTVTNQSDRMGCRLEGEEIEHQGSPSIISDGISFGAVQVPGNGQPILMLSERQSTGGYTKIANVISVDLPKAAQCRPGTKISFRAVSVEEAQNLYLARQKEYEKLQNSFRQKYNQIFHVSVNGKQYALGIQ